METEPEGTSKKYIFLVDNQDIAMNIVMSGYQALYLGQEWILFQRKQFHRRYAINSVSWNLSECVPLCGCLHDQMDE
jgi:hypothetical protein